MGRLEFTTPRQAWGGEASDFTPLLGQDDLLNYLGSACGIGALSIVEVEHTTAGGRSLDILAVTADQRKIAIENQYGIADHDHLTRGLAYAVGVGARGLVLVAEGHRDEFRSVAGYLNAAAAAVGDAGINVWLIEVRAVRRVGDGIWSPEFVVVAEPNDWEVANALTRRVLMNSLQEFYGRCASATGESWAALAESIIGDWLSRPGASEAHASQGTVSLYLHTPSMQRRTNVLQLAVAGTLTVCRGYLLETSGVDFNEIEIAELDAAIDRALPDGRRTERAYYISSAQPDFHRYTKLADTLTEVITAASEARAPLVVEELDPQPL
jgi:hypothetical protein